MTPLDQAYAAMAATPEDDAARLRYYERLADDELVLLVEGEAQGGSITPRLFPLEDGPFVLAFDSEEKLSAFTGSINAYAALPGRVIAQQLAGQGTGLAVNLGADSAMLLPPEAVDWLASTLEHGPEAAEAVPTGFQEARVPQRLLDALGQKLARAGGLASHALLAGVSYSDGRNGHLLAFIGARDGAEDALARAAAEALTFSGIDAGEMDVVCLPDGPAARRMAEIGLRLDMPVPAAPERPAPQAPGSDPKRPPRLR
ncbi:SseB family protein [Falsirhodobacter algicola]|uniref:SseB family protein n=1 Tax=Falsirhodobacter algicola TaxID=2692330 RepID=A0A8J8MRV5_9RHOB|nr:SseB family protein [Falsirhodobacter algicola]QUS35058.1 SseB family protein [Falsirhodobacter algicola]